MVFIMIGIHSRIYLVTCIVKLKILTNYCGMMRRVFHLSSQMYMVSRLMSFLPCTPQVAHTNFHPDVCEKAKSKPFITRIPASSEGSMLMVWMDDSYTIKDIHIRRISTCISLMELSFLSGKMIHAGGFCFGTRCNKPYTNAWVHFMFIMQLVTMIQLHMHQITRITIITPQNIGLN